MAGSARAGTVVVGGGPAGLAAAELLSAAGTTVVLADRMPSLGRKLLMAGRGGLNLTHSEPVDRFLDRYNDARPWLEPAINRFGPAELRAWCEELGQPCFTGSSGRVFPRAMKASPLLRAWLRRLDERGVAVRFRHRLVGFAGPTEPLFETPDGPVALPADAVVLALGGASWRRLGSDGAWAELLAELGVAPAPFAPSNCGFRIGWSAPFAERFAGEPVKSVALRFNDRAARGDLVVTADGIEGGAVYPLSGALRDAIGRDGGATMLLDLRPDMEEAALAARLKRVRPRESLGNALRKALSLSPVAVGLLRETGAASSRQPDALARAVKAIPLRLVAPADLDRAISTAGGVRWEALDGRFMLRARPGLFCCGEMLDWDAPTGGYLLQGSISTGRAAAEGVLEWLADGRARVAADDAAAYPTAP
ncbi:MAG: TIGR03862 family flavoprotein [Gluconacetobacter diazotrophicus]|nr:TIGR03862 family flavoprotein [Gluconacetobacter diazotrophicus]